MNHADVIQVFVAGDSTAASYPEEQAPMAGWAQMLQAHFGPEVAVRNNARCGRSSKSFIEEGHFGRIEENIREGDYLFIQFGHNDEKPGDRGTEPYTTFQEHLERYVELARRKKAHPVLMTPVQRRKFDESGHLLQTHGDYPDAVRQLAARLSVPLIDMTERTEELYRSYGSEASKELFVWLKPGEHPNYPDGAQDDTHFHEKGAEQVCLLVLEEIRKLKLPLAALIKTP